MNSPAWPFRSGTMRVSSVFLANVLSLEGTEVKVEDCRFAPNRFRCGGPFRFAREQVSGLNCCWTNLTPVHERSDIATRRLGRKLGNRGRERLTGRAERTSIFETFDSRVPSGPLLDPASASPEGGATPETELAIPRVGRAKRPCWAAGRCKRLSGDASPYL